MNFQFEFMYDCSLILSSSFSLPSSFLSFLFRITFYVLNCVTHLQITSLLENKVCDLFKQLSGDAAAEVTANYSPSNENSNRVVLM